MENNKLSLYTQYNCIYEISPIFDQSWMKKEKIKKYLKSSCLLTLANKSALCSKKSSRILVSSTYSSDKILTGEVTEYQIKCYLHPLFTFLIRNLPELEAEMVAELIKNSSLNFVIIISMYFRLQPI